MAKKKKTKTSKKSVKKVETKGSSVWGLMIVFGVLVVGNVFLSSRIFLDGRVMPNTEIGGVSVGMMKLDEAEKLVKDQVLAFSKKGVRVRAEAGEKTFNFAELGLFVDYDKTFEAVEVLGGARKRGFMESFFVAQDIPVVLDIQDGKIEESLDVAFGLEEKRAKNSFVKLGENGEYEFFDGEPGIVVDYGKFKKRIERKIAYLSGETVGLDFDKETPSVVKADLEAQRDLVKKILEKKIVLVSGDDEWEFVLKDKLDWVGFVKKEQAEEGGRSFDLELNDELVGYFLNNEVAEKVEKPVRGVSIGKDSEGKIVFDGRPQNGVELDDAETVIALEKVINSEGDEVAVVVDEIAAPVKIKDESLKKLGIKQLVSTGYTTYYGSPYNRIHNIDVGVKKYNGLLIAPGEKFSFNDHLGPVDARAGYRPELVIKGSETIPEYGGGLCQVSTTFYRAALYGGLPIEQRSPHSYAVSYYAQVGGHGLDATIYPDAGKDVVILNDTPGHILIQSYVDGATASFQFYGTDDGRTVAMEGPYVSNWHGPGPAQVEETSSLAPGVRKQVSGSHSGFDVVWYRKVLKSGEEIKETILSNYKAVPAKFLVGAGEEVVASTGEGSGVDG